MQALSFKHQEIKAKQGDAAAQNYLGLCYQYGYSNTEKDFKTAFHWYHESAKQGNKCAENNLGFCYSYGIGIPMDTKQGFSLFLSSADKGYDVAQFHVAICYENGRGVEVDLKAAFSWYMKAAEQGNVDAQYTLGVYYQEAKGVKKDLKAAFHWYEKAAAQGHARAKYNVARMYEDQKGLPRKFYVKERRLLAKKYYTQSAEQGYAPAQLRLVELNDAKCNAKDRLRWLIVAAQGNHPEAQSLLGEYYEGIDEKKAIKWYRKAAEQGYAKSQYKLGCFYYLGYFYCYNRPSPVIDEENINIQTAIMWYTKAANQGNYKASYTLGRHYERIEKDFYKMAIWYKKFVEQTAMGMQNWSFKDPGNNGEFLVDFSESFRVERILESLNFNLKEGIVNDLKRGPHASNKRKRKRKKRPVQSKEKFVSH